MQRLGQKTRCAQIQRGGHRSGKRLALSSGNKSSNRLPIAASDEMVAADASHAFHATTRRSPIEKSDAQVEPIDEGPRETFFWQHQASVGAARRPRSSG